MHLRALSRHYLKFIDFLVLRLQKPDHDKKQQLRQTNLNLRRRATDRRNILLLVSPFLRIEKGSTTGASVFAPPRAGLKSQARRSSGAVYFRARERNRADVNKGAAVTPLSVYGAFGEMIEAEPATIEPRGVGVLRQGAGPKCS